MENGCLNNPPGAPSVMPGMAKAWVIFQGSATGANVLASYNVSSVVRTGAGLYTITFIHPFNSPAFCYSANGKTQAGDNVYGCAANNDPGSPGLKMMRYFGNAALYDPPEACFMAWG